MIRAAVSWAFGVDPCATRKELQDSDPESLARAALIQGWSELPNAELGLTVSDALKCLRDDAAGRCATLRDCLLEISRTNDLPSPRVIGKRLQALKGRVIQGRCIQATSYQGTQVWKVVRV